MSSHTASPSGLEKAAILLVLLGEDAASSVYRQLPEQEVQRLTAAVGELGRIPPQAGLAVLEEYQKLTLTQEYLAHGGTEYATRLLVKAFGDDGAKALLEQVSRTQELSASKLDSLQKSDPQQLAKFLEGGRWQTITTIRGAVIALGIQRMQGIALSCCVLKLLPNVDQTFDPILLWEHSLACALVSRKLAKRIGYRDPEEAYLAGLLHDVGFIVNLCLFPEKFIDAIGLAQLQQIPVHQVEEDALGFTHCLSGELLAEKWRLAPDLVEAIRGHHHADPPQGSSRDLVALVSLSDRLCRMRNLGYGYDEKLTLNWLSDRAAVMLRESCPSARILNWNRFVEEMDVYTKDVHKLVSVLYRLR
ncbi:MAG TPA: HDOD domain-containing protein [Terriglobales bacterium]|nr:HDOD domain-containing protein [Terriglobales bacterium]